MSKITLMTNRLDKELLKRGLAPTRSQALDYIKRRIVLLNGEIATKPSVKVYEKDQIQVLEDVYVGRGALKLQKALEFFKVDPSQRVAMDVGASTGGFTQILLQEGAKKVYAVDTGTAQLARELCASLQVINLEKTNILDFHDFDPLIDLLVMDVSFVSTRKVLPHLFENLKQCEYIVLFKPQFELEASEIGKKGIVCFEKGKKALLEFIDYLKNLEIDAEFIDSPILGKKGNHEYLVFFRY